MKKIMKNLIFALSMIVMTLFVSSCEKEEITNVSKTQQPNGQYKCIYAYKIINGSYVLNQDFSTLNESIYLHYISGNLLGLINLVQPPFVCQTAFENDSIINVLYGISPNITYDSISNQIFYTVYDSLNNPPSGYDYYQYVFTTSNWAFADSSKCY